MDYAVWGDPASQAHIAPLRRLSGSLLLKIGGAGKWFLKLLDPKLVFVDIKNNSTIMDWLESLFLSVLESLIDQGLSLLRAVSW